MLPPILICCYTTLYTVLSFKINSYFQSTWWTSHVKPNIRLNHNLTSSDRDPYCWIIQSLSKTISLRSVKTREVRNDLIISDQKQTTPWFYHESLFIIHFEDQVFIPLKMYVTLLLCTQVNDYFCKYSFP